MRGEGTEGQSKYLDAIQFQDEGQTLNFGENWVQLLALLLYVVVLL